jgi:hypothetical protein
MIWVKAANDNSRETPPRSRAFDLAHTVTWPDEVT